MITIITGLALFAFIPILYKMMHHKEVETNERMNHLTEKLADSVNKPLTKAELKEKRLNELGDKIEAGRITSEELKELFELNRATAHIALWKDLGKR